jgi:hypothetical protein
LIRPSAIASLKNIRIARTAHSPACLPVRWREVVMARRPDVFVRGLSMDEGLKLAQITPTVKDPIKLRRAIVVLMSGPSHAVRDITPLMQIGENYVRDVIHAFNERGFDALDPQWGGGRTPAIGDKIRERIWLIAPTSPLTGASSRSPPGRA